MPPAIRMAAPLHASPCWRLFHAVEYRAVLLGRPIITRMTAWSFRPLRFQNLVLSYRKFAVSLSLDKLFHDSCYREVVSLRCRIEGK